MSPSTGNATMLETSPYDPLPLVAFTLGSCAGIADLLRGGRRITARLLMGSVMWHGLMSLATFLVLADQPISRSLLMGIAIFVGAGVYSVADVIQTGIRVKFGEKK